MTVSDLTQKEEELLTAILEQIEEGTAAEPGIGANEQMRFMEQCLLASDQSLNRINEHHKKYQKDWRYPHQDRHGLDQREDALAAVD